MINVLLNYDPSAMFFYGVLKMISFLFHAEVSSAVGHILN